MAFIPRRLSSRIVISVSFILAAALVAQGGLSASRQSRVLLGEMRDNASVMAAGFAAGIVDKIVLADYAEIDRFLLQAAELPRIERIQVSERNGRVLADVIREGEHPPRSVVDSPPVSPPAEVSSGVATEEGDRLVVWAPIRAGSLIGWIRVASSTQDISEARYAAWRSSLMLAFGLVTGSSVLMFLLLRPPLRAVRDLAAFARGLAGGRGKQIAISSGAVEIEQLSEALNHASRELAIAEGQLIAERERLAVTLNSIVDGVIATDTSGEIVLMNRIAEDLTGWRAAEGRGKRLSEVFRVIDGESRLPLVNPVQAVIAGVQVAPMPRQAVLVTRDQGERIISESVAPIIDRTGDRIGAVLVFNDVTERQRRDADLRRLEEQLRRSQRMEAVGQLSGGIAHDFNNILSAIVGYANILRLKISATDPLRTYVDQIVHATKRAANLTTSLLAFGGKQTDSLERHDLNDIVRGFSGILKRLIREDIDFQVDLCAGPALVVADRGQLEQVMVNLVTNARDAMPAGGMLRISTAIDQAEAPERGVVLTVSDTGRGMDQEQLRHIFEPFFTTKETGKGSGLGLALVARIVQGHQGTITVKSEPGAGTTFRLWFPAAGAEEKNVPDQSSFPLVGKETILLVEDEQAVRTVTKACLEEYGYRVFEAANADDALRICRNRAEPVHLLITDVVLPRKDGKKLFEEVRTLRPEVRVLFMSGYPSDIMTQKGLDVGVFPFIPKPIDFGQLLHSVRGILET